MITIELSGSAVMTDPDTGESWIEDTQGSNSDVTFTAFIYDEDGEVAGTINSLKISTNTGMIPEHISTNASIIEENDIQYALINSNSISFNIDSAPHYLGFLIYFLLESSDGYVEITRTLSSFDEVPSDDWLHLSLIAEHAEYYRDNCEVNPDITIDGTQTGTFYIEAEGIDDLGNEVFYSTEIPATITMEFDSFKSAIIEASTSSESLEMTYDERTIYTFADSPDERSGLLTSIPAILLLPENYTSGTLKNDGTSTSLYVHNNTNDSINFNFLDSIDAYTYDAFSELTNIEVINSGDPNFAGLYKCTSIYRQFATSGNIRLPLGYENITVVNKLYNDNYSGFIEIVAHNNENAISVYIDVGEFASEIYDINSYESVTGCTISMTEASICPIPRGISEEYIFDDSITPEDTQRIAEEVKGETYYANENSEQRSSGTEIVLPNGYNTFSIVNRDLRDSEVIIVAHNNENVINIKVFVKELDMFILDYLSYKDLTGSTITTTI